MARLQDFQTVTPSGSDKLLIVQSQGQGLTTIGDFKSDKMDKANPTGTGALSINRKSGTTTGSNSVAVGQNGTASGTASFSEGGSTIASGTRSHAEGESTTASGEDSHAEGYNSVASGTISHAEGKSTASGTRSHAEGENTTASGEDSHAEGYQSVASGSISHAEGRGTIANHAYQHVFGSYNVADDSTASATTRGNYIEIVGRGSADNSRGNARTLDWNGNEVLTGGLTIGGSLPLISKGTHNMQGVIIATTDGKYEMVIAVPFDASNATVTSSQFRPARQSAISETSPTIDKGVGFITVGTSSSSFANFVNKKGVATITIS